MTEQIRESVSALMDGEVEKDMRAGFCNEELKSTWHRYHLISDVMHQRLPVNPNLHLSRKISDLIKQEPAILAPSTRSIQTFLKPVAGLAIAASVAALAILGIQRYQSTELSTVVQEQIQKPVLSFGVPVTLPDAQAARPVQVQMKSDVRINRYLLNHNEYQSNVGVQGMTPHVRLVVTGADE